MDILQSGQNAECDRYRDEADFYKTLTLLCVIIILAQVFVIIIVFKMLRTQMAKLIQIHDFGLTEDHLKQQMLNAALDPTADEKE